MTLGEVLARRARESPDRLAFTYASDGDCVAGAEPLTYAELHARAQSVAARLLEATGPGARALLLFEPGLDFVCALFGCFQAGVVAISALPADPKRLHRAIPRLERVGVDASADVVLTTSAVAEPNKPLLEARSLLGSVPWLAVDSIDVGAEPGVVARDPAALAFLQYTSGSTAAPRGVMLSHANFVANAQAIAAGHRLSPESRAFCWLPASHDMGLVTGILMPVIVGYPSALMAPAAMIKRPIRWLEGVSGFRATVSGGPNFAYDLAVRRTTPEERERLDLDCWDVAFNGAEPIAAGTIDAFCEAFEASGFRRSSMYPGYGLAEATLMASGPLSRRDPTVLDLDAAGLEHGAVQPPAPGGRSRSIVGVGECPADHALAIVDSHTGAPCEPGRVGEIWLSGPSVAGGYWGGGVDGSEFGALLAGSPDQRRFLRTGDLGFMLGDELFVVGRLKDVLILYGRNHHPHDIELAAESADPRLRPHCCAAFVVSAAGDVEAAAIVLEVNSAEAEELMDVVGRVRKRVAAELDVALQWVALVDPGAVPKTTSGKIQRWLCRERLLAGALEPVAEWRAPGLGGVAVSGRG